MKEKAIEKINNELKEEMSGKVGAIAPAVAEQLKSFCGQSPEFAAAVAEKAETLKDCCKKVLENVGDSISDAEVYKRAVKFYMPDADIDFGIKIVLPSGGKTLNLSLESFI